LTLSTEVVRVKVQVRGLYAFEKDDSDMGAFVAGSQSKGIGFYQLSPDGFREPLLKEHKRVRWQVGFGESGLAILAS
jgi:hypothetical protein